MTKARFSDKQPSVRVTDMGGGKLQYQICINEKQVTEKSPAFDDEEEATETQFFEYDYNEFVTDALTEDQVKEDPSKYIDWQPVDDLPEEKKQVSVEKRLTDLEASQNETAQAVQDMIMSMTEGDE